MSAQEGVNCLEGVHTRRIWEADPKPRSRHPPGISETDTPPGHHRSWRLFKQDDCAGWYFGVISLFFPNLKFSRMPQGQSRRFYRSDWWKLWSSQIWRNNYLNWFEMSTFRYCPSPDHRTNCGRYCQNRGGEFSWYSIPDQGVQTGRIWTGFFFLARKQLLVLHNSRLTCFVIVGRLLSFSCIFCPPSEVAHWWVCNYCFALYTSLPNLWMAIDCMWKSATRQFDTCKYTSKQTWALNCRPVVDYQQYRQCHGCSND